MTSVLPSGRQKAWRQVRRLLAVRLDQLGDLLMTTPALAALKEALPAASLTLLTSPIGTRVAPHLNMVDQAMTFTAPWMQVGMQSNEELGQQETDLIQRLRQEQFDAVVIFTVCTQSPLPMAMLCRMAGIELRLAHCRENPYALLSDWIPETDVIAQGMRHEVQRQLDLVGSLGFSTHNEHLRFEVLPGDRSKVQQHLQAAGLTPSQPYAVFHPGASAASRRWPAAWFGTAAQKVHAKRGTAIVFSGDDSEKELIDQAQRAMQGPSISLAGKLNIGELAALIENAQVLVANNSGPTHLAAAVNTPVVNLYALTNPQHTPWRVPARVLFHDVDCRWCLKSVCPQQHHDCLLRVEPERVSVAALELMDPHPATTIHQSPSFSLQTLEPS